LGSKFPKPRCHLPCYARMNTRPGCALAAHVTRPSYGRPVGLWAGILRGRCLFTALPSHIEREQRAVLGSKFPKPRCHLPCYARLNARPGCALAAHVTGPSYGRPVGLWAGILRGRCLFKALPSHIKREQRAVFESKFPKPRCHLPCYVRLNTRPGCALTPHVTGPSYGRPMGPWVGL
jgi:hypothetical protein